MPAILQNGLQPGKVDVRKIFEYMSDILLSGLMADA
jgi:hypothetical protein